MKQTLKHLTLGLAWVLASFATQALAQSTPQQVQGSGWQALTANSPTVTVDGSGNKYMAWTEVGGWDILFSELPSGGAWTTPQVVGGTGWTAQTNSGPSLAVDYNTGLVWLVWKGKQKTDRVWFSTWNGSSWAQQEVVNGSGWNSETNFAPAISFGTPFEKASTVYVAWKGATSTNIWQSNWTYPGWTQQVASGAQTPNAPAELGENVFYEGTTSNRIWTNAVGIGAQVACNFNEPGPNNWVGQTGYKPAAAALSMVDEPELDTSSLVVFWKARKYIYYATYAYDDDYPLCDWQEETPIFGEGWTASSSTGPAVASYFNANGTDIAILAWKNATDDTIWFLDPTTLTYNGL